jgi:methylaspartate mutase epsilon subunit
MNAVSPTDESRWPFSAMRIEADHFDEMRAENLARWPTGAEVDIDEAADYHRNLPREKQLGWVMREADRENRCLTQPRGGFGTIEMQKELMQCLDRDGAADIVPTTTDSYTRNERWEQAQHGVEESKRLGRSMLNGFPMVNYGPKQARTLIEAINKPGIVLSGTSFPRLTAEIGYAAGYSGYLGSGLAYTVSYTKDVTIEQGIRNYQYLDRLAALYGEKGIDLHRRQPGFLTGTNVPPSIAIITGIVDALLAAAQGVRNYGLELGQTMHLIQDAAAIRACRELRVHPGHLTPLDGRLALRRRTGGHAGLVWRHAGGNRRRGQRHHQEHPRGLRHPHA